MVIGLDPGKFRDDSELVEAQLEGEEARDQYAKVFEYNQAESGGEHPDHRIHLFDSQEPESLWSFTENKEEIEKCPRRRVVRDFCFPEGVRVASVTSMQ